MCMTILLCPSMMCADFSSLKEEVEQLDESGIDIFHIDIMDGSFVPNFGMGIQDLELIRKTTRKPIDVHLMINQPSKHIDLFTKIGVDIIYIHPESGDRTVSVLKKIRDNNIAPGIAVNPEISIAMIEELLPFVDYVLIMTVNPGFAGQKYINEVNHKIKKIISMQKNYNYKVVVDGAISQLKVQELSGLGVDGFVLGTSGLFIEGKNFHTTIREMRGLR